MNEGRYASRTAGWLYLAVVLTGFFHLGYVPSSLIVQGDMIATFERIRAGDMLLRMGVISGLVCYVSFAFLSLTLYRILFPVNESHARVMVILVLISVPMACINIQHLLSMLTMVAKGDQQQMQLSYDHYVNGLRIVQLFWGLWLLPLGWMIFRSGIIPRVLGILLMLGCVSYLLNFLGNFLSPVYASSGVGSYVRLPASLGEIGTCLWLLVKGVKR